MKRKILSMITLLSLIFCVLFLYSCETDCEHSYGEWTVKTAATCSASGKEVRVCSLCQNEEERDIPATKEHTVTDGKCSVCGKTEAEIEEENKNSGSGDGNTENSELFYYNIIDSLAGGDFTLSLKDLGAVYEIGNAVINVEDLYISANDTDNLYGYGNVKVVIKEQGFSTRNEASLLIEDGKCYVKDTSDSSPSTVYMIDTIENFLDLPNMEGSPASDVLSRLPEAIEAITEYANNNKNAINDAVKMFIDGFFSQSNETDEIVFTLDFAKIKEFNNKLYTLKISELIDEACGEGSYASIKTALSKLLDMTVIDLVEALEEKEIDVEALLEVLDAFLLSEGPSEDEYIPVSDEAPTSILEAVFGVTTVEELKELEMAKTMTLLHLIAGTSPDMSEEELKEAKDSIIANIESLAEQTVYAAILSVMGQDATYAEQAKESVDEAIDAISESFTLSFTTSKYGKLYGFSLKLDEISFGAYSIKGEISATAGAINEEKYIALKNEILKGTGTKFDFEKVTNAEKIYENGKLTSLVHKENSEDLTDEKEIDDTVIRIYIVSETNTTYIINDSYSISAYYNDCKSWTAYSVTGITGESVIRYYEVTRVYDADNNLISEKVGETNTHTFGQFDCATVLFNSETKEIELYNEYETPSKHNHELDEESSKEAVGCEGEGETHYVCTECGDVVIETYVNGHSYDEKTELLGDSCEDGVEYISYCSVCGEILSTKTEYEHLEHYIAIDLSSFDFCKEHYVDAYGCACGERLSLHYDFLEEPCEMCGFFVAEESIDIVNGCYYETKTTYTIYMNDKVLKTYSGISYSGDMHDMIVTAELLPDSVTCTDGIIITEVCSICGESETYTATWHEVVFSDGMDMAKFSANGIIAIYTCPCGLGNYAYYELVDFEEYDYDYDFNEKDKTFVEYYTDENGFTVMIREGNDEIGEYAEFYIGYDKDTGSFDYMYILYTHRYNSDTPGHVHPR